MRARLSLVLFAVPLFAATTPIVGTFTLADGTPATGTITISWPRFTTAGSAVVPANTLAVSVASGSLSVSLEPVDTSTANGVLGQWYYTVRYSWRGNKSYAWRVPTSASPVNVTSIETDLPSNSSGVLPSVALTQLPPGGASIGNCLIWSGSYWGPAACTNTADPTTTKGDLIVRGNSGPDRFAAPANGVYCWTWTNGVPTYTPCGGTWGSISGTLSDQTDLNSALSAKAAASALSAHTSDTANPHATTKSQVGLSAVENTALSTWGGSASITTVGTLGTGSVPGSLLTGTIPGARLPNPAVGTKGGIEAKTCIGTDKVSAIGTDGIPVCSTDETVAASAEAPYSLELSAETSPLTITEATHGRGLYGKVECFADNTTVMEDSGCKVERSRTTPPANGDVIISWTTRPYKIWISRREKAQGPAGATGATGATGPAIGGLLTTKGDTVGYSTLAVRVPVGTNGQVLTADSTQAAGLKWGDAPGGVSICSATGTTALTCTPSPALLSCGAGTTLVVIPASTITGAVTLSATGCTSTLAVTRGATGLVSGEWRASRPYLIVRDATGWTLQASNIVPGDSTLTVSYAADPPTLAVTSSTFAELTGANTLTGVNIIKQRRGVVETYGDLPTCDGTHETEKRNISDSNTATWGATVAAGGSNHVEIRCNGTNWTVVGK